jgi:N-acetylneuraminic acid mutarotase
MKKLITLFLISLFCVSFSFSQGYWTQKMSVGINPRCSAAGMATSTKGYVACGHYAGAGVDHLKDMWEYNPLTNTWTQRQDFPGVKRRWLTGFTINNKCYVGLGIYFSGASYTYYNDFYEFDPALNTWTAKAMFPGAARGSAFSFVLNGKGYVGGGSAASGILNDLWVYDPVANTWTQKNNIGCGARFACASFSIDNYAYVGTGRDGSSNYLNDLWQYDPETDNWIQKMSVPGSVRWYATGFSMYNYGYIGTGHNGNSTYLSDFYQYDPLTNSWTSMPSLTGGSRAIAISFSIDNKGYLGTGEISGSSDSYDFWEFTPNWYGVSENANNVFSVFPNPATENLNISFSNSKFEPAEISIYDISGKQLITKLLTSSQIDVSFLAKGIYFIKIIKEKENFMTKFLKE